MPEDLALQPVEPGDSPAGGGTACCEQPDPGSALPCTLCGKPTCRNCRRLVNGKRVCAACNEQIQAELGKEQAGAFNLPFAIAGGVVAALFGAEARPLFDDRFGAEKGRAARAYIIAEAADWLRCAASMI